ncbi:hypothetical protein D3C78_1752930 [compost metagenome]
MLAQRQVTGGVAIAENRAQAAAADFLHVTVEPTTFEPGRGRQAFSQGQRAVAGVRHVPLDTH